MIDGGESSDEGRHYHHHHHDPVNTNNHFSPLNQQSNNNNPNYLTNHAVHNNNNNDNNPLHTHPQQQQQHSHFDNHHPYHHHHSQQGYPTKSIIHHNNASHHGGSFSIVRPSSRALQHIPQQQQQQDQNSPQRFSKSSPHNTNLPLDHLATIPKNDISPSNTYSSIHTNGSTAMTNGQPSSPNRTRPAHHHHNNDNDEHHDNHSLLAIQPPILTASQSSTIHDHSDPTTPITSANKSNTSSYTITTGSNTALKVVDQQGQRGNNTAINRNHEHQSLTTSPSPANITLSTTTTQPQQGNQSPIPIIRTSSSTWLKSNSNQGNTTSSIVLPTHANDRSSTPNNDISTSGRGVAHNASITRNNTQFDQFLYNAATQSISGSIHLSTHDTNDPIQYRSGVLSDDMNTMVQLDNLGDQHEQHFHNHNHQQQIHHLNMGSRAAVVDNGNDTIVSPATPPLSYTASINSRYSTQKRQKIPISTHSITSNLHPTQQPFDASYVGNQFIDELNHGNTHAGLNNNDHPSNENQFLKRLSLKTSNIPSEHNISSPQDTPQYNPTPQHSTPNHLRGEGDYTNTSSTITHQLSNNNTSLLQQNKMTLSKTHIVASTSSPRGDDSNDKGRESDGIIMTLKTHHNTQNDLSPHLTTITTTTSPKPAEYYNGSLTPNVFANNRNKLVGQHKTMSALPTTIASTSSSQQHQLNNHSRGKVVFVSNHKGINNISSSRDIQQHSDGYNNINNPKNQELEQIPPQPLTQHPTRLAIEQSSKSYQNDNLSQYSDDNDNKDMIDIETPMATPLLTTNTSISLHHQINVSVNHINNSSNNHHSTLSLLNTHDLAHARGLPMNHNNNNNQPQQQHGFAIPQQQKPPSPRNQHYQPPPLPLPLLNTNSASSSFQSPRHTSTQPQHNNSTTSSTNTKNSRNSYKSLGTITPIKSTTATPTRQQQQHTPLGFQSNGLHPTSTTDTPIRLNNPHPTTSLIAPLSRSPLRDQVNSTPIRSDSVIASVNGGMGINNTKNSGSTLLMIDPNVLIDNNRSNTVRGSNNLNNNDHISGNMNDDSSANSNNTSNHYNNQVDNNHHGSSNNDNNNNNIVHGIQTTPTVPVPENSHTQSGNTTRLNNDNDDFCNIPMLPNNNSNESNGSFICQLPLPTIKSLSQNSIDFKLELEQRRVPDYYSHFNQPDLVQVDCNNNQKHNAIQSPHNSILTSSSSVSSHSSTANQGNNSGHLTNGSGSGQLNNSSSNSSFDMHSPTSFQLRNQRSGSSTHTLGAQQPQQHDNNNNNNANTRQIESMCDLSLPIAAVASIPSNNPTESAIPSNSHLLISNEMKNNVTTTTTNMSNHEQSHLANTFNERGMRIPHNSFHSLPHVTDNSQHDEQEQLMASIGYYLDASYQHQYDAIQRQHNNTNNTLTIDQNDMRMIKDNKHHGQNYPHSSHGDDISTSNNIKVYANTPTHTKHNNKNHRDTHSPNQPKSSHHNNTTNTPTQQHHHHHQLETPQQSSHTNNNNNNNNSAMVSTPLSSYYSSRSRAGGYSQQQAMSSTSTIGPSGRYVHPRSQQQRALLPIRHLTTDGQVYQNVITLDPQTGSVEGVTMANFTQRVTEQQILQKNNPNGSHKVLVDLLSVSYQQDIVTAGYIDNIDGCICPTLNHHDDKNKMGDDISQHSSQESHLINSSNHHNECPKHDTSIKNDHFDNHEAFAEHLYAGEDRLMGIGSTNTNNNISNSKLTITMNSSSSSSKDTAARSSPSSLLQQSSSPPPPQQQQSNSPNNTPTKNIDVFNQNGVDDEKIERKILIILNSTASFVLFLLSECDLSQSQLLRLSKLNSPMNKPHEPTSAGAFNGGNVGNGCITNEDLTFLQQVLAKGTKLDSCSTSFLLPPTIISTYLTILCPNSPDKSKQYAAEQQQQRQSYLSPFLSPKVIRDEFHANIDSSNDNNNNNNVANIHRSHDNIVHTDNPPPFQRGHNALSTNVQYDNVNGFKNGINDEDDGNGFQLEHPVFNPARVNQFISTIFFIPLLLE